MSTSFWEEAVSNTSALRSLAENAEWCPRFREMTLDGHLTLGPELRGALKVLSRAKMGLVIETEDTVNLQSSVWKGGTEAIKDYGDDSSEDDGEHDDDEEHDGDEKDDDEDEDDDEGDDDEDEDREIDMEGEFRVGKRCLTIKGR